LPARAARKQEGLAIIIFHSQFFILMQKGNDSHVFLLRKNEELRMENAFCSMGFVVIE
jgi:hypothetical protein